MRNCKEINVGLSSIKNRVNNSQFHYHPVPSQKKPQFYGHPYQKASCGQKNRYISGHTMFSVTDGVTAGSGYESALMISHIRSYCLSILWRSLYCAFVLTRLCSGYAVL